ncbi:hypothetical protein B5M42_015795 [Paenibacillus athensensis]|nr:hypothetical protein [Paenibacillus athensensis]MCD1260274.1 hypothetical protein [Paenibacillus athensensis]
MKLRLLPVVLSLVITSAVLFGGWFAYNSLAMENPLSAVVQKVPGVVQSDVKLSSGTVDVKLTLAADADLRSVVERIASEGAAQIGKRTLRFDVAGSASSQTLDTWWSKALFGVAQAMETKHYADIPATLEQQAADLGGLAVDTQMDDQYVYVRLTDGQACKFVMLPRTGGTMGVWPNE